MRYFTLLLDPEGRGISEDVLRSYDAMARRRGLEFAWQSFDHAAVLTAWDDPYGDPLVIQHGQYLAVGMVRLDNRADLERWADCKGEEVTDLGLVLRVVARHGTKYIPQILGDFGFVVWNRVSRTAVAACDAFCVKKLYYAEYSGRIAFASRAEAIALDRGYDAEYLTRLVALCAPLAHLTVYIGVKSLLPGTFCELRHGLLRSQQYWSFDELEQRVAGSTTENNAIATCRRLLIESVRTRLGSNHDTWAHLSGGMDSSTVVSLIQWLASRGEVSEGLAGTITFVDRQGTGTDERRYSNAVTSHWGVRNETILEPPTWYDKRYPPGYTDQPAFDLHVYPRDRRLCELVRDTGGRVLLTGCGGDELFTGSMFFFADWLVQGQVAPALREMARRAAIGRVSFWALAYRNALLPLFPELLQRWLVVESDEAPREQWVVAQMLRRYGIQVQGSTLPEYQGALGCKYRHAVVSRATTLPQLTHHGVTGDHLDVRHPFLYRPLVEFAVQLSPELRARPYAHRWIIREAMRGILPEAVRNRVGKTATADALVHSLETQRALLGSLLQRPVLAELGIVDEAKLRMAFDATTYTTNRKEWMHAPVMSTLAVEAWLQMRSGRWPTETQLLQ